jgi:hypothetical protein
MHHEKNGIPLHTSAYDAKSVNRKKSILSILLKNIENDKRMHVCLMRFAIKK